MWNIGDKIEILVMDGEPQYSGRTGIITEIGKDPWGDTFLRGTWGGCSVYLNTDSIQRLEDK